MQGRRNTEESFWNYVDVKGYDDCWDWTGTIRSEELGSGGYGSFCFKGRAHTAHRFSWELCNGIIENDLKVCHKCDNRKCVNPSCKLIPIESVQSEARALLEEAAGRTK